jgi:carboxyl-terminal processing protease
MMHRQDALAMTESALLVDEVWRIIGREFFDKTYNGLGEEGWKQKRVEAMQQVQYVSPDDQETIYASIRSMLQALGDPYTRFLTDDQFASLKSYATGTVVGGGGIGVQLLADPGSGYVVVANVVPMSPADRAGLQAGDIVENIDDISLLQSTAEVAAAKCRGPENSKVSLTVLRRREGKADMELHYSLTRTAIQTNPLKVAKYKACSGKTVGVLTLTSFNQQTVSQVMEALDKELKSAEILVIDVRGNAGGYMPAGVDVAKLFLTPKTRVISEVDRNGRATIYINDGVGSETTRPVYVLVDEKTASASEIMAAALQDNKRAKIVGSVDHTFGKGRIQNVQELFDGSGLAVTKAKYVTPNGKDIHGVGIFPDAHSATCGRTDSASVCLKDLL